MIREPDHAPAVLREDIGPRLILIRLIFVNRPVDLDSETLGRACEIEDERADRMLPPEMLPTDPMSAECLPEQLLGRRHLTSQLTSALDTVPRATADAPVRGFPP